MPIRAENRARYPRDWPAISFRIRRDRAGWRCEQVDSNGIRCGATHGEPHPMTGSKVVLTVAHLDHTPENCDDGNLLAMCQRCHNLYDLPMRRAGIQSRARAAMGVAEMTFTDKQEARDA
jgi:hypothetical protein